MRPVINPLNQKVASQWKQCKKTPICLMSDWIRNFFFVLRLRRHADALLLHHPLFGIWELRCVITRSCCCWHECGGSLTWWGFTTGEEDKRQLLVSGWAWRNYWGANWLSALSSLPLWPQRTHVHTVLHICLCRAFTLTSSHLKTFPASFPTLIFTLTYNAKVKDSKIFFKPQNVNGCPKLSPLGLVCCASRELKTEQETIIQTQIEVSHASSSRLLSTFYLIVSVRHPLCSSSESQNELGLIKVGRAFLANLLTAKCMNF